MGAAKTGYDLDWSSPSPFFPRFTVSQVVWRAEEFMELVEGKPKRGNAVLWEEIGTGIGGINARQWYSTRNQLISSVVQTFRKKHLITLFTVPSFRFIDSQIRDHVDAVIAMQGVDHKRKLSRGRFYWSSFHFYTGKPIFARARYFSNGMKRVLEAIYFRLPPKWFVEDYDKKRYVEDERMAKLITKQLTVMKDKTLELGSKVMDEEKKEVKMDLKTAYNEVIARLPDLILDLKKPRVSAARIELEFEGIGVARSGKIATLINSEITAGVHNELLGLKKSKGVGDEEET